MDLSTAAELELDPATTERIRTADRRLVEAARGIKVLSILAWPVDVGQRFFERWDKGAPELPAPPRITADLGSKIAALDELARPVADHPLAQFVARTAESYAEAARLIGATGTSEFRERSIAIYGQPAERVAPGGITNLEAAERLIEATEQLAPQCKPADNEYCLTPEYVRQQMQRVFDLAFQAHPVRVVIDPRLASKAAAGAEQIRIRGQTPYSESELRQLIEHEGLVHTATALNGRLQPFLTCLSLGAPRTTTTQEGIATFAELVTGQIDLHRLRRIALRVKAVQLGLDGANFLEMLQFFVDAGDSPREAFHSVSRIFRGGAVGGGGIVFTKDSVYLRGLLLVHGFLRAAIEERRTELAHYLFSGRLTCRDVLELAPYFSRGMLRGPTYRPDWLSKLNQLAAFLVMGTLTGEMGQRKLELAEFHRPPASW